MARALPVSLGARSYRILLAELPDWDRDPLPELGKRGRRGLLVTDENVSPLWQESVLEAIGRRGLQLIPFVLPAGESGKNLATVVGVYDALVAEGILRDGWVVALGGGVVGDLAGFAAATYLRGIAWIQIPTSLLAMADASVGGKVGVNHKGKNQIGAFHQPSLVLTSPGFLRTLPDAELAQGMAEVIKAGLIGDPALFDLLERESEAIWRREPGPLEEAIARAIQVKIAIVEEDERELGRRQLLNLGHTFGHAIEAARQFEGIRHGEAVAVGLVAACRLSALLGLAPPDLGPRVEHLLASHRLPTRYPGLGWEEIRPWLRRDKKAREGGWTFVLTGGIGNASVHPRVPEASVRDAAAYILA